MGKDINVQSFSDMANASQKLASMSEEYKQLSNQLMQKCQDMGAAWEGADNQAFVEQISGFTQELDQMSQQLQTDADTLKKQKENYEQRQDDNISQVSKLAN